MDLNIIYLTVIFTKAALLLKVNYVEKDATSQSLTYMNASSSLAVDKNPKTCSMSFSKCNGLQDIWWKGELDGVYVVKFVVIVFSSNTSIGIDYMNNINVHILRNTPVSTMNLCNHFNKTTNNSGLHVNMTCKVPLSGNYVMITRVSKYPAKMLVLCEVNVYADIDTVSQAYGRPTFQSGSLFQYMSKLPVDGFRGTCGKVKADREPYGWWRVVLDKPSYVTEVNIAFKPNATGAFIVNHFNVYVSNDDNNFEEHLCASFTVPTPEEIECGEIGLKCKRYSSSLKMIVHGMMGSYVTIKKFGGIKPQWLILCEVRVFVAPWMPDCLATEHRCEILSRCLPSTQKCDRIKQCPDGSDEFNCSCSPNEYKCDDGHCIKNDWLCDGTNDCPSGEDETQGCDCKEGQFKCRSLKKCIDSTYRCDGGTECPDYSDESECFSLQDNFLMSKYRGQVNMYVCSMNWLPKFSVLLCEQHFQSFFKNSYSGKVTGSLSNILQLVPNEIDENAIPGLRSLRLSKPQECVSEEYVKIECSNETANDYGFCGTRGLSQHEMGPYIINGDVAAKGAWPWHVQIIINNLYACGGSIIDHEWILTMASCLDGISNPSAISVKVGTTIKNDQTAEALQVSLIITHPKYISTHIGKNMALIKVASPLKFTDFVRPICLPTGKLDDKTLKSFRYCVTSGFGNTDRTKTESIYLLQGRFDIVLSDCCAKIFHDKNNHNASSYLKSHDVLCARDVPSEFGINLCAGDGGSPLVCKGNNGLWVQVGIAAGYDVIEGEMACSVNVFNRIDNDIELIGSAIQPKPSRISANGTISRKNPGLVQFLLVFLLCFSTFLA